MKPVILNQVLHVRDVRHSLAPVSGQCDDGHTVEFTSKKLLVNKLSCVVGVGERAGGMYSVSLKRASGKALATSAITGDMLCVDRPKLVHVDRNAIRKMAQCAAVHGLKLAEVLSANNC